MGLIEDQHVVVHLVLQGFDDPFAVCVHPWCPGAVWRMFMLRRDDAGLVARRKRHGTGRGWRGVGRVAAASRLRSPLRWTPAAAAPRRNDRAQRNLPDTLRRSIRLPGRWGLGQSLAFFMLLPAGPFTDATSVPGKWFRGLRPAGIGIESAINWYSLILSSLASKVAWRVLRHGFRRCDMPDIDQVARG